MFRTQSAIGNDGILISRAIERARRGDPNALRFLYVCFAARAEEAAAEVAGDPAAARRLVRATFLALPSSISRYRGQGRGFESWLVDQIRAPAITSAGGSSPAVRTSGAVSPAARQVENDSRRLDLR